MVLVMWAQASEVLPVWRRAAGDFRPLWRGLNALNIDSSEGEGEAEMEAEDEKKTPNQERPVFNTSVCFLISSALLIRAKLRNETSNIL